MELTERVESLFRNILAGLQTGKIYTCDHPRFKEYLDKSYSDLTQALDERPEIVIGIVGDELAFEKEIFFDLSKRVKMVVDYLKTKKIERIAFYRSVTMDELKAFFVFLLDPADHGNNDDYFRTHGIEHIVAGRIKVSDADGNKTSDDGARQAVDYLNQYKQAMTDVGGQFESILSGKSADNLALRFAIVNIMENLVGKYVEFFKLAVVKEYDVGTFNHVLNVSILSIYTASRLGYCRNDCLEIGIAGLFHDIGKVYISRKIIQKTDKLTDAEFSAVRSHTVLGAEILLKYVDSLGVLPVVVAFEHHLKYNLQGYPKVPFKRPLHIASQIVSLCDVYDALTSRRSYKRDYPPDIIYDIMLREKGGLFEPELFDKFFNIIGFWPIATIVRLNSGELAIVRAQTDDFRRPKVEVFSTNCESQGIVDLSLSDEKVISVSLNPLNDGRDYVRLI